MDSRPTTAESMKTRSRQVTRRERIAEAVAGRLFLAVAGLLVAFGGRGLGRLDGLMRLIEPS
jgi:hypothetical protein